MREACPAARVAAAVLAVLAMLLAMPAGRALAAVPSGTLTIRDVAVDIDGRPVILAGDAWSIARVADATAVSAEPAAISYATTDAFADQCDGVDWATLTGGGARDLASDLADHAAEHGLYERSATADANGTVRFNALPAGMYLLARTHATQDDESCETTPMLVGVPIAEDGGIVYDVTVEPKYECPGAPTPNPEPDKPETGGGAPAEPDEGDPGTSGKGNGDDGERSMALTGSTILGTLILTIGLMMGGCAFAASRAKRRTANIRK